MKPFEEVSERRSRYKEVTSRREVNTMTKLCRNHRLQVIEQTKGRRPLRENEMLLKVAVFHSCHSSERFSKSHEYLVTSGQTLSELKDEFYCLMDKSEIGKTVKNSFFFIEDTFYDDMRHDGAQRMSDTTVQWCKMDKYYHQTGVYQQA